MPDLQPSPIDAALSKIGIQGKLRDEMKAQLTAAGLYETLIQAIQENDMDKAIPLYSDPNVAPLLAVIGAAPGLGKSHVAVELAEEAWDEHPVLHLGATHESFEYIKRREGWAHWRGHDDGKKSGQPCPAGIRVDKGYESGGACTCGMQWGAFHNHSAFAPVEYALADEAWDWLPNGLPLAGPLNEAALFFHLWVFDDIPIDRFTGSRTFTRNDLQETEKSHPSEPLRLLCKALVAVMEKHWGVNDGLKQYKDFQHWRGESLLKRLTDILHRSGVDPDTLLAALEKDEAAASTKPWIKPKEEEKLPANVGPIVKKWLTRDYRLWREGRLITPHVHLAWDRPDEGSPRQSLLRVRWRKIVPPVRPAIVLDASGDPDLLRRVFGPRVTLAEPVGEPPFPEAMTVYQLWGTHATRSAFVFDQDVSSIGSKLRSLLKAEVRNSLARIGKEEDGHVGIVTFKGMEDDAKKALQEVGIAPDRVQTDHYYNIRGANDLKECDVLVLLGYPAPNEEGVIEETCALYEGDPTPLNTAEMRRTAEMSLRNGRKVLVDEIFGFADPRMQAVLRQKSESELYQAFHRARPFSETKVREVLVFTDVPIQGVPIDGFLGDEGKVFSTLTELLTQGGGWAPKKQVVSEVLARYPGSWDKPDSLDRWIRRHAAWLGQATGTKFEEGKGGGFRTPGTGN